MSMKFFSATFLLLAMPLATFAQATIGLVQPELLADTTAVKAGKPFEIALHLHIADGWHVYWTNPGDAGAPTTLKLTVPAGFTVGPVQYPVPEKLPQPGGLVIYAYENELLLTATVTPPTDLQGATSVPISAVAGWCVCDPERCILGKQPLRLDLQTGIDQPANTAIFVAWQPRMTQSPDSAFSSVGPAVDLSNNTNELDEHVAVNWKNDPPSSEFQWIPGSSDDLKFKSAEVTTQGRTSRIHVVYDRIEGISPTSSTISGILAYHTQGQPAAGVALTFGEPQAKSGP
jgi:DsbC/DsbD-like thiol-disulfide interchange protein